jgi:TPR repeat protein
MLRNRLAEGAEHFLVCRETAGCLLGESQPAVHRDLEDAAAGPAQIDLRRGLCLQDRVPRRTGARFIASLAAVFDLDLHDGLVSWLWTPRAAWQRRPRFRKRREGPRVSGRNIPAPSSGGSMNTRRFQARAMALALGLALSSANALAADAGDYAPVNIEHSYKRLSWLCMVGALCPVKNKVLVLLKNVLANDPSAEYLLGLTLVVGDDLPRDVDTGVVWIARAAELGEPAAARNIAGRLRNGASIEVDETKIAAALQPKAEAGDVEAMRALGPMYIGGRGVKQDPAVGLDMLKRAAGKGSSAAEVDLSQLYLHGAPGVPADRPEALTWLAAAASHGNVEAMLNLGYMSINMPDGVPSTQRNLTDGFCWLMRAALLDQVQAQEKLSMMFAQGEKDARGAAIAIDLVQADLWFRLAARNPYHNNSQIRAMIEPHMTTEQLGQAKQLFEAWHPRTMQELKGMAIPLPASDRTCPALT